MSEHTEVTLERFKYCILQDISKELAEDFAISPKVDLSLHQDFTCDHLVLRLRQDIFGKQLEKVTIRYPYGWWDAIKARWFPKWAKRKWPVSMRVHLIDVKALYPSIPEIPDHPHVINFYHGDWLDFDYGRPPWDGSPLTTAES
jgi:hypothetical protein